MKNAGWPAIDGMFSILELPSSPWQTPQVWMRSLERTALRQRGRLPQKQAAANPKTSGRHVSSQKSIARRYRLAVFA